MFEEVQKAIDKSDYDNWELYFLIASSAIGLLIYLEVRVVIGLLENLDAAVLAYEITLSEFVLSALQGVILGLLGWRLFSQGDRYFAFINNIFDTKETAVLVKIGLMTGVGVLLGLIVPHVVEQNVEFVVLQVGSTVLLLGYVLVHLEIQNWKLWNEFPVLLASFLLAVAPALS